MTKNVLESRPALKHLMATVAQSSRALKRLMAEARASGDPASVLRTALSEASVVSKSAVRLAIEIGRIHEEFPSELARRGPPAHASAEILPRIEAILEYPAQVVNTVIWNDLVALFDAAAADLDDPREAFAAVDSIFLLAGKHPVTRLERLELLALSTPLTPQEESTSVACAEFEDPMTIEKPPTPAQIDELLSSPAACTIFAHRALISAKKGDRPPMDVLLGWLRREVKVKEALNAAEGLRMREVAQLIEDEVRLNEQAAARGTRERAAREEAAAKLLEAAGGVLPDLRERFA